MDECSTSNPSLPPSDTSLPRVIYPCCSRQSLYKSIHCNILLNHNEDVDADTDFDADDNGDDDDDDDDDDYNDDDDDDDDDWLV